jgi:hypothetical protein
MDHGKTLSGRTDRPRSNGKELKARREETAFGKWSDERKRAKKNP